MKIKYSEIGRDYTLDYEFEGEIVIATYEDGEQTIKDEFDFSNVEEGDKVLINEIESDIPVKVIKSAERVDGEIKVELMKPYNLNKKERIKKYGRGNYGFSRDWQEVG